MLPSHEYKELVDPPIEKLSQHARDRGYVLLSEPEHSDLHRMAHSPTIEHLKSKSDENNHKLLHHDEFEALVTPSLKSITSRAAAF